MANRLLGFLVVGLSLGFAACGGESLTLPSEGDPAAIAVETGWNGQSGRVGTELPPLTVVVTDTKNRPVSGATVQFEVTAGGGQVNPASALTGNDGRATTLVTLGSQVGPLTGVARVPVPAGTVPVQTTFTATAVSASAAGIVIVSGDNQQGAVNSTLAQPLVVKVTDGFNNPISGFTIQWAVGNGEGGSVSESSTNTDDQGLASVRRTLGGSAGNQTTVATAAGPEVVAGSPLTFKHIANAGNVSSVVKISGDGRSEPAGSTIELVVEVRDANGNPIANQPVNWLVGEGGGSVTPATNNTNSSGQANAQWTLGATPGTNTLNAVAGGKTATFTATGTGSGSPSTLFIATPPSDVTVGATISPAPVVQIRDNAGHDVATAGVEITVAKASGRGTLQGNQTVTTDGNGRAQFGDLRITGGTGNHKLIFSANDYRAATSATFQVNKASTTTRITSDEPDPSAPNQPVTVTFKVDWAASAGTATGRVDVAVTDGGGAHCDGAIDASGNGSCVLTDLTTTGQRTLAATYRGDDLFAGSTSAEVTHTVNEPPPQNGAPTANPDTYIMSRSQGNSFTTDGSNGLLNNDQDPENDEMFVVSHSEPSAGMLTNFMDNGTFTYTVTDPTATTDTFTYSIRDENGNVGNSTTVTITINP